MIKISTYSTYDVNSDKHILLKCDGNGKPYSGDDIALSLELQVRVCQRKKRGKHIRCVK